MKINKMIIKDSAIIGFDELSDSDIKVLIIYTNSHQIILRTDKRAKHITEEDYIEAVTYLKKLI